jgi:DNA-binding Xre family transcriptional regulator
MLRKRSEFPLEFQRILIVKQSNYTHLGKAMERRGYTITKQFLCQLGTGVRPVPALQLSRICEVLGCNEEQRKALALAACRDNGFYV